MSASLSDCSLMCDNHWCLLESTDSDAFESITLSKCRLFAWSGVLTSGSTVRGRKRSSKNPSSPLSLSDGQTSSNNIFIHRYAVSCGRDGESTSFFLYSYSHKNQNFFYIHYSIINRVHSVHNTHKKQSDYLFACWIFVACAHLLIPSRPFG